MFMVCNLYCAYNCQLSIVCVESTCSKVEWASNRNIVLYFLCLSFMAGEFLLCAVSIPLIEEQNQWYYIFPCYWTKLAEKICRSVLSEVNMSKLGILYIAGIFLFKGSTLHSLSRCCVVVSIFVHNTLHGNQHTFNKKNSQVAINRRHWRCNSDSNRKYGSAWICQFLAFHKTMNARYLCFPPAPNIGTIHKHCATPIARLRYCFCVLYLYKNI